MDFLLLGNGTTQYFPSFLDVCAVQMSETLLIIYLDCLCKEGCFSFLLSTAAAAISGILINLVIHFTFTMKGRGEARVHVNHLIK